MVNNLTADQRWLPKVIYTRTKILVFAEFCKLFICGVTITFILTSCRFNLALCKSTLSKITFSTSHLEKIEIFLTPLRPP